MLPRTEYEVNGKHLTMCYLVEHQLKIGNMNNDFHNASWAKQQHLYFVSLREINEGWIMGLDNKPHYVKEKGTYSSIEAATDSSLFWKKVDMQRGKDFTPSDILDIPQSFIEEFVKSNGTIKEVGIEMEEHFQMPGNKFNKQIYKVKTIANNEVIVHLPEVKTYTRDEVAKHLYDWNKIINRSDMKSVLDKYIENNL